MRAALLVALPVIAGCDRVLDLGAISVIPRDGRVVDGDGATTMDAAPSGCPLDGTAPAFGGTPLAVAGGCVSYTIGGPSWPPETGGTMTSQADRWSSGQLQTFVGAAVGLSDVVSSPSGQPGDSDRRILLYHDGAALEEYMSSTANMWTMVATLDSTMLGVTPNGAGDLSGDGLELVVPTSTGVYYASRMAISSAFSMAQLVYTSGKSDESYPFITADCQRLYVTSKTDGNVYAIGRVN